MIKCRALEEQSIFVTARGEILPCCFIYRGGPALMPDLRKIIKEENFEGLVDSWSSTKPYRICKLTCDDASDGPQSMQSFDNQWKLKNPDKS